MDIDYKELICNRKGDSHLHTNWTDGKDSIYEMIKTASKINLKWINFSEHNRKNSFTLTKILLMKLIHTETLII